MRGEWDLLFVVSGLDPLPHSVATTALLGGGGGGGGADIC